MPANITDKITRLTAARDDIITQLAIKDVDATGHGFEDFPDDIAQIVGQVDTKNITQNGIYTASSDGLYGYSEVNVSIKPGLLTPLHFDVTGGYVASGSWRWGADTVCYTDVYEVIAGKTYLFMLSDNIGTRFRSMFSSVDIALYQADVTGTTIYNLNNPSAYQSRYYTCTTDGYVSIMKDNAGKSNIPIFFFDLELLCSELM